jgi:hypothetical protein
MPRPRVPNREKKLRGTFKKSQALPELIYSASETAVPRGTLLNPGQAALLRLRPKGLPSAQSRHYREMLSEAPWLSSIDRELLLTYVRAWAGYRRASDELDEVMSAADFGAPKSAAAARAQVLMRTSMRQANLFIAAGSKLGFSPAARRALGIEIAPAPVRPKVTDTWALLQLLPGGRNEEE